MAKIIREMILTNAVIDADDGTITEYQDDAVVTHDIRELLREWNGKENITLTIRQVISMRR